MFYNQRKETLHISCDHVPALTGFEEFTRFEVIIHLANPQLSYD